MSLNFIKAWRNDKYNKIVLIWRFTLALIIFFSFDIREFPGIFIMTHQHKILWAINSGWGSLRPPVGSRGNAPVGGEGGCKAPLPKMGFRVFRPLWKPFPVTYYRVYLQVFICRKWVIFPCINADSWEKDVQLHFVSGTKFYNKNICHIVWVYWAWRLSIYFFSLFTLL
jgi:hypothetical protein